MYAVPVQKSCAAIPSNSCSAGIKCYFCNMLTANGCITAEAAFFYACLHKQPGKKERMGGGQLTFPEEAFLNQSYNFRKNSRGGKKRESKKMQQLSMPCFLVLWDVTLQDPYSPETTEPQSCHPTPECSLSTQGLSNNRSLHNS